MDVSLDALLALPAADRLELARILRRSVGYPAPPDSLALPAWERDRQARLLRYGQRCGQRCGEGGPGPDPGP